MENVNEYGWVGLIFRVTGLPETPKSLDTAPITTRREIITISVLIA